MAYPPLIPAEVPYTDFELDLIDNEPPGLFPTNQNSYHGQLRKTFADYLKANGSDLLDKWYNDLDPRVVGLDDIDEWEYMVGAPQAPATFTIDQRRPRVLQRLYRGAFTRTQRREIVESFIAATFGVAATFTPAGIAIDASGIPLFSGASSLVGSYRIYEDVRTFTYSVWIKNTITPDIAGMTRELDRITPAGIAYGVDNTKSDVLAYQYLVMNSQPVAYWRLNGLTDTSGYGLSLTANGGLVAGNLAAPGLLVPHAWGGSDAATTFDGVDDWLSVASSTLIQNASQITLEGWFKLTAFAAPNKHRMIVSQNTRYLSVGTDGTGTLHALGFTLDIDGVQQFINYGGPIALNTTYHAVGTFDGVTMRLYLNGVEVGSLTPGGAGKLIPDAAAVQVGNYVSADHMMNGVIDEVAIYNCALSAATVADHYNTGRDIATY